MDVVFVDVDTQVDFLDPAGALYVPGSADILPNIRRLLEYAGANGITTVSPVCAHTVDDAEFSEFGPHCVDGTPGQRRYFADLPALPRRVWAPDAAPAPSDAGLVPGVHYVAQKRTFPMFANRWLAAVRDQGTFVGRSCVVFGVATDVCVLRDTLDLCAAGARVRVVRDAIAGLTAEGSARAIEHMHAAGATFAVTAEIVA